MPAFKEFDAQTGITTVYHDVQDAGRVVIEKQYEAEPFRAVAADLRTSTEGERWGDMRHVGTIPMAELATMLRQDGGIDMTRVKAWLKKNPDLVTFSKFLK
jgi:hypothetical protein